ncbi:sporulation protein YqfD [Bacillota bacterium LX-D]|nr:sporulation protein YqfD [Bacillota bacterium LX-D]
MNLKSVWSFFLGYCQIRVQGVQKEKLINLAITNGIMLWDIVEESKTKFRCKVFIDHIKPLRHIARSAKCRFRIIQRRGFPFLLRRIEQRKGMVVGAITFAIILYWLSSYVWFLEVDSAKPLKHLTREKVISQAAKVGLKIGSAKGDLNLNKLEKELVGLLPEASFISINLHGTLAKIQVVEKQVVEKTDNEPANIIANKDGIIEEILVLQGDPQVKEGDTVQKGQILISSLVPGMMLDPETGEIKPDYENCTYVQAKGIVRARVWYEDAVEIPLIQFVKTETGHKSTQILLRINDRVIKLKGPQQSPYKVYKLQTKTKNLSFWRDSSKPIELIYNTYLELSSSRKVLSKDRAVKIAEKKAFNILSAKIPQQAKILDRKNIVEEVQQQKIKVRVNIETLEDIGMAQILQQ